MLNPLNSRTVLPGAIIMLIVLFMAGIFPLRGAYQSDPSATPDSGEPTESDTLIPSLTPTLGVLITRTPAPAQGCPAASGKSDVITMPADKFFDDKYKFVPDPILTYLNITGSVSGLKAALEKLNFFVRHKVSTADVTGDGVPEVLLDLTFKDFDGSVLLIFGCRSGAYVTLFNTQTGDKSNALDPNGSHSLSGIRFVQDMNGDGVLDIVYDSLDSLGTHGDGDLDYQILEWNGSTFIDLAEQKTYQNQPTSSAIVEQNTGTSFIRSHDDGTQELVFTVPPGKASSFGGSEAERIGEFIYAWNGVRFTQYCWRYTEPPKYIADAAVDGDNESSCRHFEAARRAYQALIYNTGLLPWNNLVDLGYNSCCAVSPTLVPDPNERVILEAYARYRIIVLHAAQNERQAMAADFDILTKKYGTGQPGYLFVGLARAFMNAYSASDSATSVTAVKIGCQSAIDFARRHTDISDIFDNYRFDQGGFTTSVFSVSDDIEQICPFT